MQKGPLCEEGFVEAGDSAGEHQGVAGGQGQRLSPATGCLRRGKMTRARVVMKLRMVSRMFMNYEL